MLDASQAFRPSRRHERLVARATVTATLPRPALPQDEPGLAVVEYVPYRDAKSVMTRGCLDDAATRTLEP